MPKIINLGSLCVDHVYQVEHLVQAGETITSGQHQIFAGGKGLNQSIAAARAGASVQHAGAVGADGDFLVAALAAEGIDTGRVLQLDGMSGHAVIQVSPDGENAIVIAGGTNRALTPEFIATVLEGVGADDWLVLQNEINEMELILAEAAARQLQVVLNVAPVDGREANYDLQDIALLIVNEVEAAALAARYGDANGSAAHFSLLTQNLPNTHIVLTLGSAGLLYESARAQDHTRGRLGAFHVKPIDETAAGDAFIGYLVANLCSGMPLAEALVTASAAGALAVTCEGAAPSIPTLIQVQAFVQDQPPLSRDNL